MYEKFITVALLLGGAAWGQQQLSQRPVTQASPPVVTAPSSADSRPVTVRIASIPAPPTQTWLAWFWDEAGAGYVCGAFGLYLLYRQNSIQKAMNEHQQQMDARQSNEWQATLYVPLYLEVLKVNRQWDYKMAECRKEINQRAAAAEQRVRDANHPASDERTRQQVTEVNERTVFSEQRNAIYDLYSRLYENLESICYLICYRKVDDLDFLESLAIEFEKWIRDYNRHVKIDAPIVGYPHFERMAEIYTRTQSLRVESVTEPVRVG